MSQEPLASLIGALVSLVLTLIGAFLVLFGYIKREDLWLIGGGWLFLSGYCFTIGFVPPPFSLLRLVLALATPALLLIALGLVSRRRFGFVVAALWTWSWGTVILGYLFGGWIGALLISIPTFIGPAIVLYRTARHLLPLRDESQHRQALRAFLTFLLGNQYPHWIVHSDEWRLKKVEQQTQIGGSPFVPILAGPGVVISRCDHTAIVSDGVDFKGAKPPGLNFTSWAESVPQAIDLRVQLRAFDVEGRTKDGIGIKVLAFTPFQLDCGSEVPRLGEPFPYRTSSAFRAFHQAQLIEHSGMGQIPERTEALLWDDLPQLIGTRILRDILAEYRFDDLCAPFRLAEDPRTKIADEFNYRLKKELKPCGINLVGGGISNLLPVEESRRQIFEQRIRSWQVRWVRHVMQLQAEGQRSRLRQIEKARAQAQVEAIQAISDRMAKIEDTRGGISSEDIFTLFIDVISQMAVRPLVRRLLPEDVAESVAMMGPPSTGS
ncbi:MAG: SPFH domain-containing protein [Anaerolineae bacterium]|jgi:regulator of protease activity HflC (stomatin/prohibitin superfamily)